MAPTRRGGRLTELGRQALRVNPARADHLVATRAAVSVVGPLLAVCASTGVGVGQLPVALAVGQVGAVWGRRAGWPRLVRPHFTRALTPVDAGRHLVRFVLASGVAGTVATLIGGTHPYWAMVAARAALGGPDLAARLVRGVHRIVGTCVGLLVAAALLWWSPGPLALVVMVVVLGAVVAMVVLVIVREPTVTAGEPGQEMLRP
ncbi:FUSC family protein [Aestuariimicrobium soli]|uniref:FUSC family protein n=1 Tax=Aestuariimicrobium soli TaxID=2035834 RepID=UPI003EB74706